MGVTASQVGPYAGHRQRWSVVAFTLACAGVAAATWLVLASDSDPAHVLWPLVVAPVVIALAPMLVPRSASRWAALVCMALWCVLTAASIGLFLWPALAALLVAAARDQR